MRARTTWPFALALTLTSIGGGCTSTRAHEVAIGAPLMTVLAPPGGEADPIGVLTDGRVATDGWYCSQRAAPQRYEFMFFDGAPRDVRAIGIVPGNVGPDGLGPVEVRVQTGHGVTAPGESFRARLTGRAEQLHVIVLPTAVSGDHVLVTLLRRSPYSTASCLAEVAAYDAESQYSGHANPIVEAVPTSVAAVNEAVERAAPRDAGTTSDASASDTAASDGS